MNSFVRTKSLVPAAIKWIARISLAVFVPFFLGVTLTTEFSETWRDLQWSIYLQSDKLLHFLSMFCLTIIGLIALPRLPAYLVFCSSILLAFFIEIAQHLGPRSADHMDFVFSFAGTMTIAVAYYSPLIRARIS